MPNHVKNVWKISHIPQDKVNYILNKVSAMVDTDTRLIDFDLIIPEPRIKKDCPKDCIVNKDSHVMEDKDRPWFDWYAWHNKYWNTKWNAYDGYTKIGKTYIQLVFNTAWSFAEPVARQLAELGYDLDLRWADEDYGSNCGRVTYNSSEHEWENCPPDNPEKFARNLWDVY